MKHLHIKYYSGLLLIAGLIMMSSCNKLELEPETSLTEAGFWNNVNDLKNASNYFYAFGSTLRPINYNNNANWSDDGFGQGVNPISSGTRQLEPVSSDWSDNYRLIRACNTLLENSSRVQGVAAEINRYRGEARFFRALAHFYLVQRFGDVPLVLRTFDIDDPELSKPARTPREQVLDAIYEDLDFAAANMYKASQLTAGEYGRATSGAALALKSRVALFAGTFNKFHSKGDVNKHLTIAVEASEALMNSGQYALFNYAADPNNSYLNLFRYEGDGTANKESILIRFYGNSLSAQLAHNNYTNELGLGPTGATRSLVDSYLFTDGLPKGKSALEQTQVNTLTEYENRDPRLAMTTFNKTHIYQTNLFVPGHGHYRTRKYYTWSTAEAQAGRFFVDNILMRYGEVLLNYAEAKYELTESISDADLEKSINLLRARAKMPAKLTNAHVIANGLNMREEIRRERRVELAMELDFRYWDLIRWKTAETELPKPVLGRKHFQAEMGNTNAPLTPEGYFILQPSATRQFNPQRDYLWPIPTKELGLNPNLTQNPNWQ